MRIGLRLKNRARMVLMPGFDLFTRRRTRLARYWRTGPRRFLDAGMGNGWFAYLAYESGATVVAVTNEPSQVAKAREFYNGWLGVPEERLSFREMHFYELDRLDRESFDEIVCYEALEHVLDDRRVCQLFNRLLVPEGDLHLCCPNAEHPRWIGEGLDERGEWGGHVRAGYTLASFRAFLEPLGFELTASEGVGGPVLAFLAVRLQRLRSRFGDIAVTPLAMSLLPLVALDRPSPEVPYCVFSRFRKTRNVAQEP